ncbi:TPA: hypothetical protein RS749_001150 [Mannheimia haemolytica]|nr:hypothetical protein [Mannheimia haemolytica]HDZ6813595.1 hypothetical protein [Mannheimia haemolytica]
MIDIKSELLSIEQQRKQQYISLIELLSFLKKHNPNSDFQEIATYLLIKLTPNDVRKTNEELWGNEDFENWCDINGISTYRISKKIDEIPKSIHQTYFFEALEWVRDNFLDNYWLKDNEKEVTNYIKESDQDIFIDRKRIDELLGVSTLNIQNLTQEKVKQQTINVGMALTKTEDFIKNTDINKSPAGTAERLAFEDSIADLSAKLQQANTKIIELEKQLEQAQSVQLPPVVEVAEEPQGRMSKPQRALFSLLLNKLYPDGKIPNVNSVKDAINEELKKIGLSEVSYNTIAGLMKKT